MRRIFNRYVFLTLGFIAIMILLAVFLISKTNKEITAQHSRPLLVLIEQDPWATVIGSDTPRVAIYDDGTLIYLVRPKKERPYYNRATLNKQELRELFEKMDVPNSFAKLKSFYDIRPNVTDLPTIDFYYFADGQEKAVSVYGFVPEGKKMPAYTVFPDETKPDDLPDAFKKAHSVLTSLSPTKSEKWIPEELELMIWPFDYAKESVAWPKGWPAISDPKTRKRNESYSLYMPGTKLDELRSFLNSNKGAVELDGKKWALSFRFVFPGEAIWRKALTETSAESQNK
jgi:hypothetical protein